MKMLFSTENETLHYNTKNHENSPQKIILTPVSELSDVPNFLTKYSEETDIFVFCITYQLRQVSFKIWTFFSWKQEAIIRAEGVLSHPSNYQLAPNSFTSHFLLSHLINPRSLCLNTESYRSPWARRGVLCDKIRLCLPKNNDFKTLSLIPPKSVLLFPNSQLTTLPLGLPTL